MTEAEAEELRATEEENYRTNLLRNHLFIELIGQITNIENTNQCRKDIARFVHFRKRELLRIPDRTKRNGKFRELRDGHATLIFLLISLNEYRVLIPELLIIPFFNNLANGLTLDEMNNLFKAHYKHEVF
jgi:hypothetical protein